MESIRKFLTGGALKNESSSTSEDLNSVKTLPKAELEELVFQYYYDLREKRRRVEDLLGQLEDANNYVEFLRKNNLVLIGEINRLCQEKKETEFTCSENTKRIKCLENGLAALGTVLGDANEGEDVIGAAGKVEVLVTQLRGKLEHCEHEVNSLKTQNSSLREQLEIVNQR